MAVAVALPRWPVVGRRSELEVVEQALDSGERAGLVIHGRAGVGRTRLADECAQQAAASGHPTERVAGSRTTALLPLGAVAVLLAGGLGRPGPDGQVRTVAVFEETRRATPLAKPAIPQRHSTALDIARRGLMHGTGVPGSREPHLARQRLGAWWLAGAPGSACQVDADVHVQVLDEEVLELATFDDPQPVVAGRECLGPGADPCGGDEHYWRVGHIAGGRTRKLQG